MERPTTTRTQSLGLLLLTAHARKRIKYEIACLCYQIIIGTAPQYLAELAQIYVRSWSLCSFLDDGTSKENSMVMMIPLVVVPFASLLHKPGILFLLRSVTALPSLPSRLALSLIHI